ncbi:MAG: hypothetical protein K9N09_11865, partial [Candidatus Cloacimonetes bacterium]|nr:hypothetical protein [Candidatus Cloacimonadota bacterium]
MKIYDLRFTIEDLLIYQIPYFSLVKGRCRQAEGLFTIEDLLIYQIPYFSLVKGRCRQAEGL